MPEPLIQVAICTQHGPARDVVEIRQKPRPVPGSGEVRVKMLAAPINPSDVLYCQGDYGVGDPPPAPVGFEGVGIVEESGGGLLGWLRTGSRVAVIVQNAGTWGTECVTQSQTVFPVPESLTLEQAASYFINPATALMMTRYTMHIPEKGWLMQSAASSSVGRMLIRLGQHYGFRTVNLVRREEQVAELNALGADSVLIVDEQTTIESFQTQVRSATGGDLPGFAVDPVGGHIGTLMFSCLGQGGRMLSYAALSKQPVQIHPRYLMIHDRHLQSFWLGRDLLATPLIQKIRIVRELEQLHRAGLFQVEKFQAFPLADVTSALNAYAAGTGGQKILLTMT